MQVPRGEAHVISTPPASRRGEEQLESLYLLLRRSALVIRYYLHTMVFPEQLSHQAMKLSANGQERSKHGKYSGYSQFQAS